MRPVTFSPTDSVDVLVDVPHCTAAQQHHIGISSFPRSKDHSTTALTLFNFSFKVVFLSLFLGRDLRLLSHSTIASQVLPHFPTFQRCTPPGVTRKPTVCPPRHLYFFVLPYCHFLAFEVLPLLVSLAHPHLKVPPQQSPATLRPSAIECGHTPCPRNPCL